MEMLLERVSAGVKKTMRDSSDTAKRESLLPEADCLSASSLLTPGRAGARLA